jgi:hypothetical protein
MRLSITGLLKLGMCTVRNAVRLQWNDQSIHAAGRSESKLDDREVMSAGKADGIAGVQLELYPGLSSGAEAE